MEDTILFEVQGNIGVMQVNRPEARNALNWAAQERFAQIIKHVAQSADIRVLIITGTGDRAFVSGGDLKELSSHLDKDSGKRLNRIMRQALVEITMLPIPVIAAINGDAFGGGCEILTACDLRLAANHARMGFAQIQMALTTGWGGTGRLVSLLGQGRAMDLLLTGRVITASEALNLGLVHRLVYPENDVLAAAKSWAVELARLPTGALAATKALVHAAVQYSPSDLDQLESRFFIDLWNQPDHQEAVQAFQDKRLPRFNQDWPIL